MHKLNARKLEQISMHRLTIISKTIVRVFLQFQKPCNKLSTFSHSNDFLALVMLIFNIYGTGYSSLQTNKLILLTFLQRKKKSSQ